MTHTASAASMLLCRISSTCPKFCTTV